MSKRVAAAHGNSVRKRRRLTREARYSQLIDTAWKVIHEEGTDALSLGRLAEAAGITKPTVYEHFGSRHGLLTALYQDFDSRHGIMIDDAIAAGKPVLQDKARVIASSYILCVLNEGREIPGVLAALSGSPELAEMRKKCQHAFLEKCRQALAPFLGTKTLSAAALWAMLGAADALASVALSGEVSERQACHELYEIILAMAHRAV
ncbi:TetR/AcrR family transcriptional regulator [Brenneria populi subsp. brevivirga]|uniref:TetR/AcrR family transcriptional regulator n=1 Tax=Brenneria populi TaxID=1505588 RepID=UPI002E174CF1|nr:TetR/AcrR family transcriptional regulator [Brenneria populi subsp. brevivirga]